MRSTCTAETPVRSRATWSSVVSRLALTLPYVIERPSVRSADNSRFFAVDVTPVGRRQAWLVTHLCARGAGAQLDHIGVVLPFEVALAYEALGCACTVAALPAGHVLAVLGHDARPTDVVEVVLTAYRHAVEGPLPATRFVTRASRSSRTAAVTDRTGLQHRTHRKATAWKHS